MSAYRRRLDIALKSYRRLTLKPQNSVMIKNIALASLVTSAIALFCVAVSAQDHPIMDRIAQKVIQKYQQSTCEQLWQERAQKGKAPENPMEKDAIQALKGDPQMRKAFIDQIAAPIANKMFECGMIP